MTDETTSEQLSKIKGQAEDTPATEYTPPEGWRVVQVGEVLREGDMWVNHEGEWPTKRVGERVNDERYIRRIEPQPEPQPVQVREGRWQTRGGEVKDVGPTPPDKCFAIQYPWWDGDRSWNRHGSYLDGFSEHPMDLLNYLGPIELDKTQEPPKPQPIQTGWYWTGDQTVWVVGVSYQQYHVYYQVVTEANRLYWCLEAEKTHHWVRVHDIVQKSRQGFYWRPANVTASSLESEKKLNANYVVGNSGFAEPPFESETTMDYRFYLLKRKGLIYVSIRHINGNVLYTSEGYTTKEAAIQTLTNFIRAVGNLVALESSAEIINNHLVEEEDNGDN